MKYNKINELQRFLGLLKSILKVYLKVFQKCKAEKKIKFSRFFLKAIFPKKSIFKNENFIFLNLSFRQAEKSMLKKKKKTAKMAYFLNGNFLKKQTRGAR